MYLVLSELRLRAVACLKAIVMMIELIRLCEESSQEAGEGKTSNLELHGVGARS